MAPYKIARVIARPFVGEKKGQFTRTKNRHDYSVKPPQPTVLDAIKAKNIPVSESEITMVPQTYVKLEGDNAEHMLKLLDEFLTELLQKYPNVEFKNSTKQKNSYCRKIRSRKINNI